MTKVAFLYFDDIHHTFHSVTIACKLASLSNSIEVELLTSTSRNEALLKKIVASHEASNIKVVKLAAPLSYTLFHHFRRRFPRKSHMLKKHHKYLATFTALIGTDFTTGQLRRYLKHETPKLILTLHGAGDRSYGFKDDIKSYDFILISGEKVRKRLDELGFLQSCDYAVTGYAKFDYKVCQFNALTDIFPTTSDRITVLYNPHCTTHLSSWAHMGSQIIDFFCESDKYNLIFAPHIMLFDPRFGNKIEERWKSHPHIHIDTGSLASADMSYTNLADVYIGDVSSQAYEFIVKPRYCIYVNAHNLEWQNDKNFLSWTIGDIIDSNEGLEEKLAEFLGSHEARLALYAEKQLKLVNQTFSVDDTKSPSTRSAEAVIGYLDSVEKHQR